MLWGMSEFSPFLRLKWGSLVAQTAKNQPAMGETWIRFPGWEDLLEESRATHPCSCLENPMGRGAWLGYRPQGRKLGGD